MRRPCALPPREGQAPDPPPGGGVHTAPVLTIGEFSRLTHLSVRTLRRYHDAGLLVPDTVDPATGYRYYGVEQIPTAQVIHRLRELDVPLPEVQRPARAGPGGRAALVAGHLRRLEARAGAHAGRRGRAPPAARPGAGAAVDVELRAVPATTAAAVAGDVDLDEVLSWYAGAAAELEAAVAEPTGPPGGIVRRRAVPDRPRPRASSTGRRRVRPAGPRPPADPAGGRARRRHPRRPARRHRRHLRPARRLGGRQRARASPAPCARPTSWARATPRPGGLAHRDRLAGVRAVRGLRRRRRTDRSRSRARRAPDPRRERTRVSRGRRRPAPVTSTSVARRTVRPDARRWCCPQPCVAPAIARSRALGKRVSSPGWRPTPG